MAKSITQNGITFSNYATGNETYSLGKTIRLGSNEGLDEDNFGIVNAADIAWNGALVEDNVTINSTGDLLSWIKTKGGSGITPGPGPLNPDEPTDSSPSVVTLKLDEFNEKKGNGLLEEKILYIVIDANGKILFMYQIINGKEYYTYMPEPSLLKETGTTTLDNFNNLTDSEKASKNWIITDENGNKIGIALEGVLLLDAKIEEAEVDGVGYKVMIVDSYPPEKVLSNILYLVKDNNGKITTSYLNGNEIELEKVNGLQKSEVTEMFKKDFVKDNQGNIIGLKHTGISIDKNGDGEIIESTEFNSYLNDYTNKAGFISNADDGKAFAELFATSSTKGKLKSSEIIAAINKDPQGGETSSVTINADKIDLNGILRVKVGDTNKTASELLVNANELSSRVSNIENNRVYVSNINLNDNTIDLNVKYTDGNSLAQNASLTLGVDANDSSKIVITADLIKLKGNTFADTIFSGFVTADLISANQIKSKIATSNYIALIDPNDTSNITALTSDGMYFSLDATVNYYDGIWNLQSNWNDRTSITNNGLFLYPKGINEGYGVTVSSWESNGQCSGIQVSGSESLSQVRNDGVCVYNKPNVTGKANWNVDLSLSSTQYVMVKPNVIQVKTLSNDGTTWSRIDDHSISVQGASNNKFITINSGNHPEILVKDSDESITILGDSIESIGKVEDADAKLHLWSGGIQIGTVHDHNSVLIEPMGIVIGNTAEKEGIIIHPGGTSYITAKDEDAWAKLNVDFKQSSLVDDNGNKWETGSTTYSAYAPTGYGWIDKSAFEKLNQSVLGIYSSTINDREILLKRMDYDPDFGLTTSDLLHLTPDGIVFGVNTGSTNPPAQYIGINYEDTDEDQIEHYPLNRFAGSTEVETLKITNELNITNSTYLTDNGIRTHIDDKGFYVYHSGIGELSYDIMNNGLRFDRKNNDNENPWTNIWGIDNNGNATLRKINGKDGVLYLQASSGFHFDGEVIIDNGYLQLNGAGYASTIERDNNSMSFDMGNHGTSFDFFMYKGGNLFATINAATFTQASDATLKNIVSDITLTAEQIANAPAVNFTWKSDEDNINHVGSIAQYWLVVMPEVVNETGKGTLGLDYATTALMSAITVAKEVVVLKSKVEELEAENNRLKIRLAQIEEKLGL